MCWTSSFCTSGTTHSSSTRGRSSLHPTTTPMKPQRVRAAAVQLSPVLYSREGTTEKVCAAIAQAAGRGAQLVVFPETVVPYYPYFSFVLAPAAMGKAHLQLYEQAVTVPGPTTE